MAAKKGLSSSEKIARRGSKAARTRRNKLSRVVHNTQFSKKKLDRFGNTVDRNIEAIRENIRTGIENGTGTPKRGELV